MARGGRNIIGAIAAAQFILAGGLGAAGPAAPVNSVAPVVTGTETEGQTLSCTTGTWSGSPTYAYQWKRNGANIGSATANTYVLVGADVGTTIKCTVTATNAGGSTAQDSNTTGSIAADPPVNSVAPMITGIFVQGRTVQSSTGTWSGSPTYTYQWKNGGVAIDGATNNTYVIQSGDVGAILTCMITATNAGGSDIANSNSSPVVGDLNAPIGRITSTYAEVMTQRKQIKVTATYVEAMTNRRQIKVTSVYAEVIRSIA